MFLVRNGYDKNKTELEITSEMKIPRIYGPGNLKYIFLRDDLTERISSNI